MLKIQRLANGEVVFTLSGRMDAEQTSRIEEHYFATRLRVAESSWT